MATVECAWLLTGVEATNLVVAGQCVFWAWGQWLERCREDNEIRVPRRASARGEDGTSASTRTVLHHLGKRVILSEPDREWGGP